MIKTVIFRNYSFFKDADDCIVLRRVEKEPAIKVSLPFHEDTANLDLTISEAIDLRNALNDVIGPVPGLPAPREELFPSTQISVSDQSAFSGLFDRFPTDSEGDKQARRALRLAAVLLNLPTGWCNE
ncbi:hypothetical protein P4H71_26100 [Paenibacillus kribbensis]|uniref:hypothetical protein n=1 Tax=Paenibacillus kribbensis TaxID=172713 RepID=UPI002DBF57ED|nr:hypothetical protein [Paenibacillus kribbensis]MEC0237794.1 hypothetical protein [Paenibacillus kribbensis]